MLTTHALPPCITLFDYRRTSYQANPFFGSGVLPGQCERHFASLGFDAAYFGVAPRSVPATVPADCRDAWLRGFDEGEEARRIVDEEEADRRPWDAIDPQAAREFGSLVGAGEVRD